MSDPREAGSNLDPKYDSAGLVTAVVTASDTGELLMVAHMNAEALAATRTTGKATFWSRSRQALWVKGETSGNVLSVREMRIDCDQDAIWIGSGRRRESKRESIGKQVTSGKHGPYLRFFAPAT